MARSLSIALGLEDNGTEKYTVQIEVNGYMIEQKIGSKGMIHCKYIIPGGVPTPTPSKEQMEQQIKEAEENYEKEKRQQKVKDLEYEIQVLRRRRREAEDDLRGNLRGDSLLGGEPRSYRRSIDRIDEEIIVKRAEIERLKEP